MIFETLKKCVFRRPDIQYTEFYLSTPIISCDRFSCKQLHVFITLLFIWYYLSYFLFLMTQNRQLRPVYLITSNSDHASVDIRFGLRNS